MRERDESDLQHFANIAGTEDLVDDRELVGIVGREIRGENAIFRAPPSQQLARCARGAPAGLSIHAVSIDREEIRKRGKR